MASTVSKHSEQAQRASTASKHSEQAQRAGGDGVALASALRRTRLFVSSSRDPKRVPSADPTRDSVDEAGSGLEGSRTGDSVRASDSIRSEGGTLGQATAEWRVSVDGELDLPVIILPKVRG